MSVSAKWRKSPALGAGFGFAGCLLLVPTTAAAETTAQSRAPVGAVAVEQTPTVVAPVGSAEADTANTPAAPEASSPALVSETSSSLPEDPKQQAKRLFSEAEERYLAGDLAGALVLMRELHQLSGRPELLVNLGDLERELHHCVDARRYYEAYLASAKTGTKRERALRFKLELERECPEPAAVQARPVTVPPKSEKPGWSTLRIAGWSSLGATAVLGVAATYFALEAARDENRLEARIRSAEGGQGRGFSQADQELEADGQRAAGWAKGFAVGAAGLAATGISLLLLDAGHADRASSSLSLGWQAGSPRAVYQASF